MAKRHTLDPSSWQSVFGRLEELILANSGEDEFAEVFKMLTAKLYMEWSDSNVSLVCATPEGTRDAMNSALAHANRQWPGILGEDRVTRLEPEHLQVCMQVIDSLTLRETSLEVMDGVFEYLISHSAKGVKGQYFTPRNVIEACIQIVDPRPGEILVDPACGSSGFLLHAMQHATRGMSEEAVRKYSAEKMWGFDIDQRAIQISRALTLVAGAGEANLYRLNSLINQKRSNDLFARGELWEGGVTIEDVTRSRLTGHQGFDVVVTNPPFAGEVKEESLISSYELANSSKRNERDVLFIERCVELLKPGGRMAIVLPTNKVGVKSYAHVREWLLRRMRVVSVLSLGRNTFQPHTSQKAEVIFAIKRPRVLRSTAMPAEPVLLMISESEGKDVKGNTRPRVGTRSGDPMWVRADHDLDEAVSLFREFVSDHGIDWGVRV